MRNSETTIGECLAAIFKAQTDQPIEVIVIDDFSQDKSVTIASNFPCTVIQTEGHAGVSWTRNQAARKARGDTLIFVDSDVIVPENTFVNIQEDFKHFPNSVIMGIYSSETYYQNFFSQYKNLYHYHGTLAATTPVLDSYLLSIKILGSHLLAIKRDLFFEVGGFNEQNKRIEDVELGLCIAKRGIPILLDNRIRAIHKRMFGFVGLMKTDIKRLVGLAKLYVSPEYSNMSLHKDTERWWSKLGIFVPLPIALAFMASVFEVSCLAVASLLCLIFFVSQYDFISFLRREKGIIFAAKGLLTAYVEMLLAQVIVSCIALLARFKRLRFSLCL